MGNREEKQPRMSTFRKILNVILALVLLAFILSLVFRNQLVIEIEVWRLRSIKYDSMDFRGLAREALVARGRRAEPAFLRLLTNRRWQVRYHACIGLASLASDKLIPSLWPLAEDEQPDVRAAAQYAILGLQGHPKLEARLLAFCMAHPVTEVSDDVEKRVIREEMRSLALRMLARRKLRAAVEMLLAEAKESHWSEARTSYRLLSELAGLDGAAGVLDVGEGLDDAKCAAFVARLEEWWQGAAASFKPIHMRNINGEKRSSRSARGNQ